MFLVKVDGVIGIRVVRVDAGGKVRGGFFGCGKGGSVIITGVRVGERNLFNGEGNVFGEEDGVNGSEGDGDGERDGDRDGDGDELGGLLGERVIEGFGDEILFFFLFLFVFVLKGFIKRFNCSRFFST